MKNFTGKTAVVTGAASGIGRGLAQHAARLGMNVVLADVEEEPLTEAARMLEDGGAEVLAVRTDVSNVERVESLAQQAIDRFGSVQLLFNNAGVGSPGRTIWKQTIADWQWVLGVNLWGVIHGVRTFIPLMQQQGDDCHIVNTASIAGLTSSPWRGAYAVAKHGVVTLSEMLYHELAVDAPNIGVSVLCPGSVATNIQTSKRNRPATLANAPADDVQAPQFQAFLKRIAEDPKPPSEIAEMVFAAVTERRFYILTHPEYEPHIRARFDAILHGVAPSGQVE